MAGARSPPTATTCAGRRGTASTTSTSRCAGRTRRGRRAAQVGRERVQYVLRARRRRGGCASSCCSATSTSPTSGSPPTATAGGARSTAPTARSSTAAPTSSCRARRSRRRCRSGACRWRSATRAELPVVTIDVETLAVDVAGRRYERLAERRWRRPTRRRRRRGDRVRRRRVRRRHRPAGPLPPPSWPRSTVSRCGPCRSSRNDPQLLAVAGVAQAELDGRGQEPERRAGVEAVDAG